MRDRREFMAMAAAAVAARPLYSQQAQGKLGCPGLFPGRVVAVADSRSHAGGAYQTQPVREMIGKGMMELTGAPSATDAWRMFVQKGDVVGIKLTPVGGRRLSSDPAVLHPIIEGLKQAGIPAKDVVVYDRYRKQFLDVGFHKWLPEGVRWSWASEDYDEIQTQLVDGYDRDQWVEMQLCRPEVDPRDPHNRRSYLARFITQQVNKLINVPVLKHHQSAGVTIALKNLSHGLVNNVSRSHINRSLNACSTFIPAIVDHAIIRQKNVLNIVDGVRAGYNGGPGGASRFMWEHKTMYFSTDPVAVDKVGWKVIDAKRAEVGMVPVSETPTDQYNSYRGQPEHIEHAALLGLGVYDDKKMEVKRVTLG